jgi:hypothetical protein
LAFVCRVLRLPVTPAVMWLVDCRKASRKSLDNIPLQRRNDGS